MNKLPYYLICFLLIGCSSIDFQEKSTSLVDESQISTLSKDDIEMLVGFNSSTSKEEPNILTHAFSKNVAGFTIVYTKGNDDIYIIKNKRVIASIDRDGVGVSVYGPHPAAPTAGTEKLFVNDKYLSYRSPDGILSGSGFVFEDYGLDGIDVKYKFDDVLNAESFLNGKKCERTIIATAACCTDSSGELRAYRFTPSTGWKPSTIQKLIDNCQKRP